MFARWLSVGELLTMEMDVFGGFQLTGKSWRAGDR
jgi:hypothetical protein